MVVSAPVEMSMSKIFLVLPLALCLAVGLAGGGCSTASTAYPTDCKVSTPTTGIEGATCAVAWSCSSDELHYQIVCDPEGSNWSCTCTTDTSSSTNVAVRTVVVNPFSCSQANVASTAAAQCGWNLSE